MRKLHAACSLSLLTLGLSLGLIACSDDDGGESTSYDTLQLCVDALKGPNESGKDTKTSISECIRDKTIGGAKLSFTTKAECVTYVTANTTGFMPNAIDMGCQMYIDSK
jgi:hypothetical protein